MSTNTRQPFSTPGRPLFIVDWLQWYQALGLLDNSNNAIYNGGAEKYSSNDAILNMIGLDPSYQTKLKWDGSLSEIFHNMACFIHTPQSFPVNDIGIIGMLGHNFGKHTVHEDVYCELKYLANSEWINLQMTGENEVSTNWNTSGDTNSLTSERDGWSLRRVYGSAGDDFDCDGLIFDIAHADNNDEFKIGSLLVGDGYIMPHSANMSLSMHREYGGTKEQTTINGSSISNTMYTGSQYWGDLPAWALKMGSATDYPIGFGTTAEDFWIPEKISSNGRRVWNLTFSYWDEAELIGPNTSLGTFSPINGVEAYLPLADNSNEYDSSELIEGAFNTNIVTDDSFFSKVWQRTLGGSLNFIFVPGNLQDSLDNSNTLSSIAPGNIAICKFRSNSLKMVHNSPHSYDVSVVIEEVF